VLSLPLGLPALFLQFGISPTRKDFANMTTTTVSSAVKPLPQEDSGNAFWSHGLEYSVLTCPRCGEHYLHHRGVTAFDRGEDDDTVTKTVVTTGTTTAQQVSSEGSGNPSKRRHGLSIQFECECCGGNAADDIIEMTIAQHKGCTLLAWRYTPLAADWEVKKQLAELAAPDAGE